MSTFISTLFVKTITPLPKHDKTLLTAQEFTSYGKSQHLCPEGKFDGEPQRRISTTQRHMPELLSYWKEKEAETKGQFLFLQSVGSLIDSLMIFLSDIIFYHLFFGLLRSTNVILQKIKGHIILA